MKTIISTALVAFFVFAGVSLQAEVIDRIAVVVNGDIITSRQVDQKAAELRPDAQSLPWNQQEALRKQATEMLIEETLVEQKVKELKITVSDEELAAAQKDVERSNHLTSEQLVAALTQQGMSYEAFRDNLRKQLLRLKLLRQDILKNARVTEREINEYFRVHIDDYRKPPMLHLGTIAVSAAPGSESQEAVKQLEEVRQRLTSGEDFAAVLDSLTLDPGVSGSDLGNVNPSDLNPVYAAAIESLDQGETSQVLAVPGGARLFYVLEKSPGQIRKLSEVHAEIEKKLSDQRTEQEFKKWAQDIRKNARIEIL
jgi:peptidyl-prolyl cis-trans isomerase SurA